MAAKDGSMKFDFEGSYTNIENYRQIEYEIADGRKVNIIFEKQVTIKKVTMNSKKS